MKDGSYKKYYYAQCSNKNGRIQKHISVKVIEDQLFELLGDIKISSDFHDWFVRWLKEDNKKESLDTSIGLNNLESQITY